MSKSIGWLLFATASIAMVAATLAAQDLPEVNAAVSRHSAAGGTQGTADPATTPTKKNSESMAIRKVIEDQRAAWNRHDLEAFMAGYWNSPELTFFSGGREYDGWQASLDRYKTNYQGAGHEMGQLDFRNLRIEMLGPEAALARGEYHLTLMDGKTPHGLFTLVFRKFPDGWKIVHDHSAAE